MAYAIGCLGSGTDHAAVYRRERQKSATRKVARRLVPRPTRNQNRQITFAVISREGTDRVRVIPVRQGHLHHVKQAYFHADTVKYLGK